MTFLSQIPYLFFILVFSARRKSCRHKGFWLVIKKGTTSCVASPSFLSFLFLFVTILHVIQILSGPKTFLYISFVFFQSWIGDFLFFLPIFDREFLFPFAFFRSLIGIFFCFFFVFFRGQGLTFSPWVKVYDKLGFWLKACRTAGHDICQGLASGSGIKGMSYIISMIHMQQ